MARITASKAKPRFGELLDRVTNGEAVAGLRKLQQDIHVRARGKAKLSDTEVRAAIEAGRL